MPKATGSVVNLAGDDWTQIATASQPFMLTVISGEILIRCATSKPAAIAPGHVLNQGQTFGDSAFFDDNVWAKSSGNQASSAATIVITK